MRRKKVLVVEDNEMNMELVRDLIQVTGIEVIEATEAKEGIELARSEKPDLILMDVGLPGLDGREATRILKRDPETASIPVIGLTSHAMYGDRERGLEVGMVAYVSKPINTRELVKMIKYHVGMPDDG